MASLIDAAGAKPRLLYRPTPVPSRPPGTRRSRWAVLLLVAGYLLFCHGCHGDEDDELFALEHRSGPGNLDHDHL
jgi:hypothetical protein